VSGKSFENKVIGFRRALHRVPELDFELPRTRAFLLSVLEPLGCEIRDLGKAGFTAYFAAASGGAAAKKTIAFRSDMDAIPIREPAGCAFRSEHEGAMHACGHDGHMGMLLGLAAWIAGHPGEAGANALLVFQAAEETTGGAKLICDTGVLRDYGVSRIYGIHLWPGYPENTVVCRPGAFMAGTFVINVIAEGRAAHIAEYQKGADALEAGCLFVLRAYELEKALPASVFRLIRFGEFQSGSASNIVADRARITGAIRAYDDETFDYFKTGLEKIMRGIETETGVKLRYEKSEGYPAVVNPPALYEETRKTLAGAGFSWFELKSPILQAEDFSYYQREAPGLFMHLGTGEGARLHSPEYTLDESVLMTGVGLMRALLIGGK
jgi:hippurate hydrolase